MNTTAEASFADDLYAAITATADKMHIMKIPMLRYTPNTPTHGAFVRMDEAYSVAIRNVCDAYDLPKNAAEWLHVAVTQRMTINGMFRPFEKRTAWRLDAVAKASLRRALANDERFAMIVELLADG